MGGPRVCKWCGTSAADAGQAAEPICPGPDGLVTSHSFVPGERTWTTDEMTAEFEVQGFAAPWVVVRRRSDGVRGTLEFTHAPRRYFDFTPVR